jgi:hypothetical protein
LIACSVKEKLKSGEIAVSGDQWPVFLFAGYTYDTEDPWNRLFRSNLLVYVSQLKSISTLKCLRATSIGF